MTVTLNLINGFSFGRPVWYLSLDASIPLAAAIEHNTYAPLMGKLLLGDDDTSGVLSSASFSLPTDRNRACNNPLRQGLSADLADGHRPNNVLGGIPTIALDYSPAWDAQLYSWTDDAIDKGFRGQLKDEFTILTLVQDGLLRASRPGRHLPPRTSPSIVQLFYVSTERSLTQRVTTTGGISSASACCY